MTKHVGVLELRSAFPIETRDDDPLASVTRQVAELGQNVASFRTETEQRMTTELGALATRLDGIETRASRPGNQKPAKEENEVETRAFAGFLRRGRESLPDVEVRTLRVSDDTAGGYLATDDFVAQVDKGLVQFSPVRQAARVGQTSMGSVVIPRRTGRPTGYWVGETEDETSTGSTYGQAEIEIHQISAYVDVSNKLLEDAQVDVAAEVAFDLAEEFGRTEGSAFVVGDGVKKPLGFMADTNLAYTAGGDASNITFDGIISLFYALHPYYRSRSVFMCNGSTLAALRKIKDGQSRYIWEPAVTVGQPETILGRPVVEAPDMADIGSNAYPLVCGDFNSGFRIFDRVSLSLLRDPYTQATKGLTRFHARRRVGGSLVRAEAIRKLKIATS